jgi:DNA-3-methyladenine glycosylase II
MARSRSDERAEAHRFLLASGPPLAALAAEQGPIDPYNWDGIRVADGDPLAGLVLHIVSQQLSVKVALQMYARVERLVGGAITAAGLAATTEDALREQGLARAKGRALVELGQRIAAGEVDLAAIAQLDDAAAVAALLDLRGVGPWSAQVFLMHELHRPDVFPAGDVGLRAALAELEGRATPYTVAELEERVERWRPYRSYAAGQLWTWRAAQAERRG